MEGSIIEDIGVSHAEAKIYLALLELGPSKTGAIIEKTKLQSSTVYHLLSSLLEKGLVSYIFAGKIKLYEAARPDTLKTFLEDKLRRLKAALPELMELEQVSKLKQEARVYEGIKGMRVAFEDVLSSMKKGEEYYFFQVPNESLVDDRVVLFLRNYHLKRSEKGIRVKGLAIRRARNRMKLIFEGMPFTKLKFIDEFLPTGLIVYKDKVITLDWGKIPTAFVIQSETVANSYKKFFLESWKKSKE